MIGFKKNYVLDAVGEMISINPLFRKKIKRFDFNTNYWYL